MRSPCCTRRPSGPGDEPLGRRTSSGRRRRSAPRSTRSASAPPCSSTPTTSPPGSPTPSRRQAPNSARSASTPVTSGCWPGRSALNSTALGATKTRIVVSGDLDEFAIAGTARRARRHLRRRHLGRHRLRRPDREHGLQAGRGGRHAGGEAQRATRSRTAAARRRRGWPSRREPSSRRSSTPPPRPPRSSELVARDLTVPLVENGEPVADLSLAAARDRVVARAGQPAVGRPETVPRRARDSDPDGFARRPRRLGGATPDAAPVTELLATAVAALGGSERSGQVEMAEAVAHAFDAGEHLAVQAGTGTGKSLAYLVPAIAAGASPPTNPVVVSTATIALQRQLVDRDLPALADSLADALPRRPDVRSTQGPRKLPVPEQDSQRRPRRSRMIVRRRNCSTRRRRPHSAATCNASPPGRRPPRPATATS